MGNRHKTFLIALLVAIECSASEPNFGIMVSQSNGVCASFGKEAPPIGASIDLIYIEESLQSYHSATLGNKTEKCSLLENAMISGPYFKVIIDETQNNSLFGIVAHGKYTIQSTNNFVTLKTSINESIDFRSCASTEGIHFSAWSQSSLIGKEIWGAYYYLGYDIEPNCMEQKTEHDNL